jgi:IS30 family transposase
VPVPERELQNATTDGGKEFACYTALENLYDIQVYFADSYSSWQRGSNENVNGLLRDGHDFAMVSDEVLADAGMGRPTTTSKGFTVS